MSAIHGAGSVVDVTDASADPTTDDTELTLEEIVAKYNSWPLYGRLYHILDTLQRSDGKPLVITMIKTTEIAAGRVVNHKPDPKMRFPSLSAIRSSEQYVCTHHHLDEVDVNTIVRSHIKASASKDDSVRLLEFLLADVNQVVNTCWQHLQLLLAEYKAKNPVLPDDHYIAFLQTQINADRAILDAFSHGKAKGSTLGCAHQ